MIATLRSARFPKRFIVVEGPNGIGKSSVTRALAERLRDLQPDLVHETREPTDTDLGMAIRKLEPTMPPRALALACAADRLDHISREIQPKLANGSIVVCDRFLPSSLVLQRLDGFTIDDIWQLNAGVTGPDVTVYLEATRTAIQGRLSARPRHSRFEDSTPPEVEIEFYRDAREFLSAHGWPAIVVSSEGRSATDVAADIAARLA